MARWIERFNAVLLSCLLLTAYCLLLTVMFNRLLLYITGLTCLATAAGFLARSWWVFELFSHFRVQYLVVLAGCGIIFLARKRHREVVLAIVFALVNFSVIGNYHGDSAVQASIESGDQRKIRALMVNVNNGNHAYEKLYKLVRRSSPDFVVLLEINEAWTYALHPLLRHYPYARIQDNEFGIALLSLNTKKRLLRMLSTWVLVFRAPLHSKKLFLWH